MTEAAILQKLGWKPFFQQQLSLEELEQTEPVRVMAVHRDRLDVAGASGERKLQLTSSLVGGAVTERPTVGDWLLLNRESDWPERRLQRSSLIRRMAPGAKAVQLIAANIDSVLIVSSCNQDFSPSRIERFLTLVRESGCQPYLVLTKADLCTDPQTFRAAIPGQMNVPITVVNARDESSLNELKQWLLPGETVAMLGSSGVGKSTLLNSLSGTERAATQAIREDDAKGRHTTRHRELFPLPQGALLLDSPGMRELGLVDVEEGMAAEFEDIEVLARDCRFSNCGHASEPGCAVQRALAAGELDVRRLQNWQKLQQESQRNDQTLAERRASDRSRGKFYRSVLKQKPTKRGGDT